MADVERPEGAIARLAEHGVAVEEGPVDVSVYFRDPDGNLIEVGSPRSG